MGKNKLKSYPLRMEEEIKEKLKVIAKENERNLNGEIVYAVKKHIREYEAEHGEIEINSQN